MPSHFCVIYVLRLQSLGKAGKCSQPMRGKSKNNAYWDTVKFTLKRRDHEKETVLQTSFNILTDLDFF